MKTPAISVVVPVYKVEKYLDRCVQSILTQTFTNFELILVDDGSPDNCGNMCDAYAKQDSRVQVVHKENGGLSDARNVGKTAAVGEYILFVDSDDYIAPHLMETLYTLAKKYHADISCGGAYNCYQNKKISQFSERKELVYDGVTALKKMLQGQDLPGSAWGKLYSKNLCNQLDFQVGKYYEDAFFQVDMFPMAKTVAVTTEPLYYYIHRAESITTHSFREKDMDVIEAYQYTLQQVTKRYPQLISQAKFRLYWAHFIVLDRMMEQPDYKNFPQYQQVVSFLKKNWFSVCRCPYFNRTRRIAAVALKINVKLYYWLSTLNQSRAEVCDE